jgi:hypothetical protein
LFFRGLASGELKVNKLPTRLPMNVFNLKEKTMMNWLSCVTIEMTSLAKPLKNKAKPQQSVSLFTCKNNFNNFGWMWWMWWVFVCRLIVSNEEIHVFMTSPFNDELVKLRYH